MTQDNPRLLCQDLCRKLAIWFASRVDARQVVRRWFREAGT